MFDDDTSERHGPPEPGGEPDSSSSSPSPSPSPALAKFHSCRWRCQPDQGAYCTHRDVLPMAGKEGFNPEAWCPDCSYYKLRRTPRKRERVDYTY